MAAHTIDVVDFAMPSLGADMTEGRITQWLVQPGDVVHRGQIVLVVETDKSDIEVEVFEPGRVTELLVTEGEVVEVGTPIARIERATGTPPKADPGPAPSVPRQAPATHVTSAHVTSAHATPSHVTSPVLRHLAEQMHVDAATVTGSGPGGRVLRDDIERAAGTARAPASRPRITPRARRMIAELGLDPAVISAPEPITADDVMRVAASAATSPAGRASPAPSRTDTMRRHIADLMSRSWQEIPHYHVSARLDLSALTAALTDHNASRPLTDRVVPGAALLWAAARAAAAVPACNGWWRDGQFEPADRVDLGVVLSLRGGGLIVPTVADAGALAIVPTMTRLADLVQRARQGRLRASDVGEASITVTNLGDLGAESVIGVIHPPQVVLVGFGAIHDDVWAVGGEVVCRPTVTATLTGDHRAIDGLTGSRYLSQLQAALDRPLLED